MKKVILLNGSPRKNWNTHRLLLEAERGAREAGAETELFHLFDLSYTDCKSCFACKTVGGVHDGLCFLRDELRPVLEKAAEADGIIIGSPIYYGNLTAPTLAFINRFFFPSMYYEWEPGTQRGKKVREMPGKSGMILTMNAGDSYAAREDTSFAELAGTIRLLLGSCDVVCACDTFQFSDYSKYHAGMFDAAHKAERREKQFPIDLQNAYELGKSMV